MHHTCIDVHGHRRAGERGILLDEWAYIYPWASETERHCAYNGFIHFYNHHRSHGSLQWATPMDIIRDNLPALHT